WTLFELKIHPYTWATIFVGILILCLLFTTPIAQLKKPILRWFQTDFRKFISILFGAFLIVVAATYLQTFSKILLILSATTLSRMELQTVGIKNWLAFLILLTTSLLGLSLGAGVHYFIKN
ncbi:MAG: hypothetical protein SWJ54_21795, partial [Cyanobacteriota bacterium]|nr:hypothetical protein [Cyanobacteriota bacterium]